MLSTRRFSHWLLATYKRRKQASSELHTDNALAAARTIVRKTKYAFLVTAGASPWPSARLVEPLVDRESFDIHIGSHPGSRKNTEIDHNPHVTVAFGSDALQANLVVHGIARIVDDATLKRRYWKGVWRLFFPDGSQGSDYSVIAIEALRIELLSFSGNVIPEPFGLTPLVLERSVSGWVPVAPGRQT